MNLQSTTTLHNGVKMPWLGLGVFQVEEGAELVAAVKAAIKHGYRSIQYVDTYKALEKLYNDGRVKAIGVCNFEIEHLERLLNECDVKPVLNQVECHPYLVQKEIKEFCAKHDIFVEAWSPLEQGGDVLKDDVITKIAAAHGKTPAQVVLRWHLQNNTIVIPKSVTPSRIEENFNVFDFALTAEEIEQISQLNINRRRGSHPNEMHVR